MAYTRAHAARAPSPGAEPCGRRFQGIPHDGVTNIRSAHTCVGIAKHGGHLAGAHFSARLIASSVISMLKVVTYAPVHVSTTRLHAQVPNALIRFTFS